MIHDVDEVLRQVLIRELPIKNGGISIEFEQPTREWSARISRPALNLFLYDVRENNVLRRQEWEVDRKSNGTATRQRTPVRIDLHYMITAWGADHKDEHMLLTWALMALFRHPALPNPDLPVDALPESLRDQPVPIPLRVAQNDTFSNPADVWSALDNELRPVVACVVTLALNPYRPVTGPLVRTRELQVGSVRSPERRADGDETRERFWMVGGTLRGAEAPETMRLRLVERGELVPIRAGGQFVIGNLAAGKYTIEIAVKGRKPSRHEITVPSPNYDVEV